MIVIPEPVSFEWDTGNRDKNWEKHKVSVTEAEEVFFDEHKKLYPDPSHSAGEYRGILIGKTKKGRLLFIAFTVRDTKVRVISSRDLNKREKGLYEKTA